MKKSNRVVLGIFGAALVLIFGLVISVKVLLVSNNIIKKGDKKIVIDDEKIVKTFDIKDFDELIISRSWQIDVKKGDQYGVEISVAKGLKDFIKVSKIGRELHFSFDEDKYSNFGEDHLKALIVMPQLKSIKSKGAVHMKVDGFQGGELNILISGASAIEGKNSKFETVKLKCSGASHVDFKDVVATNCDFDISGASNFIIHMGGGSLTGSLSGIGNVEYLGKVSRKDVKVSGLGRVKEAD